MIWMRHKHNFEAKIEKTEGCWIWRGSLSSHGYGRFQVEGTVKDYAHRWAWYFEHGTFPVLFVCHECDNPRCVKPAHLFLGTTQDNTKDAMRKGRHTGRPYRITPHQRELVKIELAKGLSQREIAKLFNCGQATISEIKRGAHAPR